MTVHPDVNLSLFPPVLTGFSRLFNGSLFCWDILYRLLLLLLSTLCLNYSSVVRDSIEEKFMETKPLASSFFFNKTITFVAKGSFRLQLPTVWGMNKNKVLKLEIMWSLIFAMYVKKAFRGVINSVGVENTTSCVKEAVRSK